jgi:hypothetical protein
VRVPIVNVDSIGIIRDVSPFDLPPEAWSDGANCRVQDGAVEKFTGHIQAFAPVVEPYWLLSIPTTGSYFWIYAGLTKVYAVTGTLHTDITRVAGGDYGGAAGGWTGGTLNGVPILNNGFDVPQMGAAPAVTTALTALSNWPAAWRAGALRPFKQFLVALDVTKTGTRFQQMVAWSHGALPGAVPSSWDEADVTKDAGNNVLSETAGFVVDCLPLRDYNIIYKDDSVYLMQFVGGIKVFNFLRLGKEGGIIARNCARSFTSRGEKHFVFGKNDMFVHDGQNFEPLLRKRLRRFVYDNLDATFFDRSFVAANYAKKEMWACYPTLGNTLPNQALVWNWLDGSITFRDLPSASFIESGLVSPSAFSGTWGTETTLWEADLLLWSSNNFNPALEEMLMAVPGASTKNLFVVDNTNKYNGVDIPFSIERQGHTIVGVDSSGRPVRDPTIVKQLTGVWPRFEGPAGTVVQVYVGGVMNRNAAISWTGPFSFTIGVDERVSAIATGRGLGVKFTHTGDAAIRLMGYDIDVAPVGQF